MKVFTAFWMLLSLTAGIVPVAFSGSPAASGFFDVTVLESEGCRMTPWLLFNGSRQADALIVWDAGGFITHPGAGLGGADVSMASEDVNVAGGNVRQLEENEYFRIADRFELSQLTGLIRLSTFGYEPFVGAPSWKSRNLRIWSGQPDDPDGEILFEREYGVLDVEFTGVYRILHLDDLEDTRRPVYEISWDLTTTDTAAPLWLEEGEYWIDWQVIGGVTGWSVYVMQPNPEEPDQPVTPQGEAIQLRPVGWAPLGVTTPFLLFGLFDKLFEDRFEESESPKSALWSREL